MLYVYLIEMRNLCLLLFISAFSDGIRGDSVLWQDKYI